MLSAVNYFTHGRRFVNQPYFLAGTAIPDWLNVVNRRIRVRPRATKPFISDGDMRIQTLAHGILQHHHDDAWFHKTAAFAELSLEFTCRIRDMLKGDEGLRPSFLGHILVELLLDSTLIQNNPQELDRYYDSFHQVDPNVVVDVVTRISGQTPHGLDTLIPRFLTERFLYDYLDDAKLLVRLNMVMRRVKVPALPESFVRLFPEMRLLVTQNRENLLREETIG